MGVVVDTPGAVTCALHGRPKSEGIMVHTWSRDGSLAGPLLLEFIVGWNCVGVCSSRAMFDGFIGLGGSQTQPKLFLTTQASASVKGAAKLDLI